MSNVTELISCSSAGMVSLPLYHTLPRYVMILTGILSNMFLLVGMAMDPLKCFRNSPSYLIMNLAVTDMLTCCTMLLVFIFKSCRKRHEMYEFFKLPPYIAYTSILTMACDRYMSCVHPFKYRVLITGRVALRVILVQSLCCAGYVIFEMLLLNVALILKFFIALLIIFSAIILYARSAYILKVNSRYLKNATIIACNSEGRFTRNTRMVNEKRLLRTMLLVSSISAVTATPFIIYESVTRTIHYVNKNSLDILERAVYLPWLQTLLLVNFSINPLMYVWRLRNYRATFSTFFLRFCRSREN